MRVLENPSRARPPPQKGWDTLVSQALSGLSIQSRVCLGWAEFVSSGWGLCSDSEQDEPIRNERRDTTQWRTLSAGRRGYRCTELGRTRSPSKFWYGVGTSIPRYNRNETCCSQLEDGGTVFAESSTYVPAQSRASARTHARAHTQTYARAHRSLQPIASAIGRALSCARYCSQTMPPVTSESQMLLSWLQTEQSLRCLCPGS